MDKVTQDRINLLHPSIREEVRSIVAEADTQLTGRAKMRIVQGFRSFTEQDALYAQGRTKPGAIVTKAKGGQSYHNYGLAVDFALLIDGKEISWNTAKDWDDDKKADWMEVVDLFVTKGYKWGKAFNDLPHFEKSPLHWKQLLVKYNNKDFIPNTKFVNI